MLFLILLLLVLLHANIVDVVVCCCISHIIAAHVFLLHYTYKGLEFRAGLGSNGLNVNTVDFPFCILYFIMRHGLSCLQADSIIFQEGNIDAVSQFSVFLHH